MSLLACLLIWVSGYVNTVLLGVQSRNAAAARYAACASTSFLIAISNTVLIRGVVVGNPWLIAVIIGFSGSCGICTAIFINTRVIRLSQLP